MIRYHFDLYPRDDPKNGARLVRFTKLQSAEYRGEANGTGSGRFSIRADTAEAQFIDPAGLQYVRVVREDTVAATEAVVGGFFLDSGDFTALDERGTRLLQFGGAGTLSYLSRAIMASHTYISPIFTGQDPIAGVWNLWNQSTFYANGNYLGAMLWRVLYEATHFTPGSHRHADGVTYTDTHDDDRPENALPDLTLGFDAFQDSNAADWTVTSGEFKAMVGENVLQVVKRLMEAGLYVDMNPDTFELNAYPASGHRRTRTGASWGANVVRFQAPTGGDIDTGNIKSDAKRAIAAFIKRSWLLAGSNDTYGDATGTSDIPWEGFYHSDTADATALAGIAGVQTGARDDAGDTARLRIRLGTDTSNGYYRPFEDVRLDDLVTVHTGTTQWDWNEQNFPVAAITVVLRSGGDWDAWVELGSSYSATPGRQFQVSPVAAHNHPPNPELCRPGDPATPASLVDSGTSKSDDQFAIPITVAGESDNALYVAVLGDEAPGVTWRPGFVNLGTPGASEAMTEIASVAVGGNFLTVWRLLAPSDSTTGTSAVLVTGSWQHAGAWYLADVNQADPEHDVVTATGTGTASAVAITADSSDLILDVAGWSQTNATVTVPTVAGDQVSIGTQTTDRTTGFQDFASGYGYGDATPSWDFTNSHPWAAIAVAVNGSSAGGEGGDGTPDEVGTSIRAARCDHNHHHNDLLDLNVKIGGHDASAVNVTDSGGYFTGTDVEAALQELGAATGGSSGATGDAAVTLTASPAGGFVHIQNDKAVSYGGYTYVAYIEGDGGAYVAAIEEATRTTETPQLLRALTADVHNQPVVLVRESDHKLVAVYTEHATTGAYLRVSANSLDTDPTLSGGWAGEVSLHGELGGTEYTYPSLFEYDDTLYLFIRSYKGGASHVDQTWGWSKSTDGGTNWTTLVTFYTESGQGGYIVPKQTGSRVDILVTEDAWEAAAPVSVYHGYFDLAAETFHNSAGTSAGTLPFNVADLTLVYDATATSANCRVTDVGYSGGRAYALFMENRSVSDVRVRWGVYDGSWTTLEVSADNQMAGDVLGNRGDACLDSLNPAVVWSGVQVGVTMELHRYVIDTAGTVHSIGGTSGSAADQYFPTVPRDRSSQVPVLWLSGSYTDTMTWAAGITTFAGLVVEDFDTSTAAGASALDDLTDVTITSAVNGDMLRYNGTAWVNTPGRWEVVVSGTAPPVAVSTPDDDDWVYAWVNT